MSKGMLADEGQSKVRTLSTDIRVIDKPASFKIKFQNFNRKPRQKHVIIEKERLYDENLQLKQLSNSLQDENHKLKTRLLQFENDAKRPIDKEFKSMNLVNSLKFQIKALKEKIEKLQLEYHELKVSVKATRVFELEEEAKQYFNECWRLKKIIEEGFKGKVMSSSNQSRSDLLDKIREQAGEIEMLKSENAVWKSKYEKCLKDAQGVRKELQETESELKSTRQKLESVNSNKEEYPEDFYKEESKESLAPPQKHFKRGETKVNDRNIDRELGNNTELILDRFFKNLNAQISNKYLSNEEFLAMIDPEKTSLIDLTKFPVIFQTNGFNFSANELKAVYSILSAQGQMLPTSVIMNALDAIDQESNKSYDISSESSYGNNIMFNNLALAKIPDVELPEIEEVLDYLYTFLRFQEFTRDKFAKYLDEKLPASVTLPNLAKLFFEKACRIEAGVERNKVCSYVMNKNECLEKGTVIDKVVQAIFKDFPEDSEETEKKFSLVMEELNSKKEEFIEACVKLDKNDKGWLSWKLIESALKGVLGRWDSEGVLQLKIKCFGIEKSLNIIPFSDIFNFR